MKCDTLRLMGIENKTEPNAKVTFICWNRPIDVQLSVVLLDALFILLVVFFSFLSSH